MEAPMIAKRLLLLSAAALPMLFGGTAQAAVHTGRITMDHLK
jgi:hypothetical protein